MSTLKIGTRQADLATVIATFSSANDGLPELKSRDGKSALDSIVVSQLLLIPSWDLFRYTCQKSPARMTTPDKSEPIKPRRARTPTYGKRVTVSLRLPVDLHAALMKLAFKLGLPANAHLLNLVEADLNRRKKVPKVGKSTRAVK